MSDIGGVGNSAFDATFFRIEFFGMGLVTLILISALFIWFLAARDLPPQLALLLFGLGLFLGILLPLYWSAHYAVNNVAGLSRLMSGAPVSMTNGALTSIGLLTLAPRGRRAFAIGPIAGALLVWVPVLFS